MVHALSEAWRVLRPEGYLIDLRPAIVHARIGISGQAGFIELGVWPDSLDDSRAASKALRRATEAGLFRRLGGARFTCSILASSVQELQDWLDEPSDGRARRRAALLIEQVHKALQRQPGKCRGALRIQVSLLKFGKMSPSCR
jgi:hypothetical protein